MHFRRLDQNELAAMADFYNNVFTCNYEDLPPEMLGHQFIRESSAMAGYSQCLKWSASTEINLKQCSNHLGSICGHNLLQESLESNCPLFIKVTRIIIKQNRGVLNEVLLFKAMHVYLSRMHSKSVLDLEQSRLRQFIRHGMCIERVTPQQPALYKLRHNYM